MDIIPVNSPAPSFAQDGILFVHARRGWETSVGDKTEKINYLLTIET
jgi:hypothetical protein